jgi:hypothetical protein
LTRLTRLTRIAFAAFLLAAVASSILFINPAAWGNIERYLHEQRVETCWLKQRMNRGEPERAAKIKVTCERWAAEEVVGGFGEVPQQ